MFLLDTNVVSELRKFRPHGAVVEWLAGVADSDVYLSAVTLGEIQAGIEKTRQQDAPKAADIELWVDKLTASAQILSVDGSVFRLWAKMMHGKSDELYEDAMIAATATVHGLTVVTRNVRDFVPFGVSLVKFEMGKS